MQLYDKAIRPKNQGRLLPYHIDTKDPEAVRGTRHLRSLDPNLVVGLDRRRQVYMVWGPSIAAGGWTPICDCQDDHGTPYRGHIPWPLITQALKNAREGEFACETARRLNEERERRQEAEWTNRTKEALRYAKRAVAGEREGWGRWSADDVSAAYRREFLGEKPGPVGQKIFIARG